MGNRIWAVVVIVVSTICAVTVLSVTGAASAELLQVISTAVVPTVTILLIGERIGQQVDAVHKQVNGRMTELIARVGEPTSDPRGE